MGDQTIDNRPASDVQAALNGNTLDECLTIIYGIDAVQKQKARIRHAISRFADVFETDRETLSRCELHLFRAPGRTEIGGNHTDHQHGQVLAAAIDRDLFAVVSPFDRDVDSAGKIRIFSEGFGWTDAELSAWTPGKPDLTEEGTVKALLHGIVDQMLLSGRKVGGFCAYVTSDVPEGSGLSSSAAFEVLIGTILNELFNEGSVPAEELANMAQTAENQYYGKPCGLMDQMASAVGGLCHMDFRDPAAPVIRKLDVDLAALGYCICVTNTHGSHADYTEDYVAVQADLAAAAGVFGKTVLEGVSSEEVIAHSKQIRQAGGDRAFLRAMHVAAENERVAKEALALTQKNTPAFLGLVRCSGNSSYKLLQNVHTDRTPARQELAVALAISEAFLDRETIRGACRVHGGGFAGTIQAFVPESFVDEYCRAMDDAFGEGSCFMIRICPKGGVQLI